MWVNIDSDLMDVRVSDSNGDSAVIHATQHHLFWDQTKRRWVEADNLAAGDELMTGQQSNVMVVSTRLLVGSASMWDLTIADEHDFLARSSSKLAPVLVHNFPVDPREVHGDLRAEERGIDVQETKQIRTQYAQDDGQLVYIRNRGNGTSDVVVRPAESPSVTTYVNNLRDEEVLAKFARRRWFDPGD